MSHKSGTIGKNDENGLHSQNVFNVIDTQMQTRYPVSNHTRIVSGVVVLHASMMRSRKCAPLIFFRVAQSTFGGTDIGPPADSAAATL